MFTLLDLCVSSLRRGHANLLCTVPILTDDPRRESNRRKLHELKLAPTCSMHARQLCSAQRGGFLRCYMLQFTRLGIEYLSICSDLIKLQMNGVAPVLHVLCCQPETIPRSLAARLSQLTSWEPCRLLACSGRAISTACSTYPVPWYSTTLAPKATEDKSSNGI